MPAHLINFVKAFAPDVVAGNKRQTIRKRRNRPINPGDELRLYTGLRTTGCRLLLSTPCTAVAAVRICPTMGVVLGADKLAGEALEQFARADGFQNSGAFLAFFNDRYNTTEEPFEGVVIYWGHNGK